MATSCRLSVSQDCQKSTQSRALGVERKEPEKVGDLWVCFGASIHKQSTFTSYGLHLCFRYTVLSAALLLFPLLHALQGLQEC